MPTNKGQIKIMKGGTFNVSRRIWENPFFRASKFSDREAFLWLLSEASWQDRTIRSGAFVVDLNRGQLSHSLRFMASKWGWHYSAVRRFMENLENRNMVRNSNRNSQNIVTICNYNKYQNTPQGGATATATATATAPQQRRIPEEIPEQIKEDKGDLDSAILFFNGLAISSNWPSIKKLTKARQSAIKARIRDVGGYDNWEMAMIKASQTPFLTGQNKRQWAATFDWLHKEANFTKLIEGNYNGKSHNTKATTPMGHDPALEQIARLAGLGET